MAPTDMAPMATRKAIKDIMKFWLAMGCDGYRVDMAGSLVKGDDENATENIKLWQDLSGFMKDEFPEAVMVSEWGEPKKSISGGFHMDFLLHFNSECYNAMFRCEESFFSKRGKGNVKIFAEEFKDIYASTNGKGLVCIPSGNHDMIRLARGRDEEELKICFAFLLSMPGAPYIYYGDEIGMRYVEGLTSVEGGFSRTGSRSPMQWDSSVNSGFSTARPGQLYISIDEDKDRTTVEKQSKDENSLLNEIKQLIAIRKEYPALQSFGEFEFVYAKEDQYPCVYKRKSGEQEIIIALNPKDRKESCAFNKKVSEVIYSVGGAAAIKAGKLRLPPCSATFFLV